MFMSKDPVLMAGATESNIDESHMEMLALKAPLHLPHLGV
jgi:hypothetical protein